MPFPGDSFEAAAAELRPCLVVVDVTYLDEALVRPLMIHRFAESGPVLVFVSESGPAWCDDLATTSPATSSWPMPSACWPDRPPQRCGSSV